MKLRAKINEHPLIAGLGVLLVVLLIALAALRYEQGQARRGVVARSEEKAEIRRLAQEMKDAEAVLRQAQEARGGLSRQTISNIAAERKMTDRIVSTVEGGQVSRQDGLMEHTIDVALAAVRREDLALFLNAVEASGPSVRTKELHIERTRPLGTEAGASPRLIDARVKFSAYEKPEAKTE